MAPSSGHLLVPKALKAVQFATTKITALIRSKLPTTNVTAKASLQSVRVYAQNQPVHPLALLRQSRSQQNRWFNTHLRTFTSSATKAHGGVEYNRSRFPTSTVSKTISQQGVAPFASTLRPNLTGGALPRTAGGYSIGGAGKTRHFSHTPGCQAQVVHNVNAGIRAFFVGGGKTRYDGIDPMTGEKRFRAISSTEDRVYKQFERPSSPVKGTNLEFRISPTVTALLPSSPGTTATSLQTPNLLTTLSSDFARSLRSLSLILSDLNRLSMFGDLPLSFACGPEGPILTVRFAGCDADVVSRLCDEVGVFRGVVKEDDEWKKVDGDEDVQMALLFPFAPNHDAQDMESDLGPEDYFGKVNSLEREVVRERVDWRETWNQTTVSEEGSEMGFEEATLRSPILRGYSPSGYESVADASDWTASSQHSVLRSRSKTVNSQDYEGLEGIYKFLQVCDDLRR
ncbi:MAG: hypothetical protein Q9217_003347 [Psora testacea]